MATAENDVADFLRKLCEFLGKIADWFDDPKSSSTTAASACGCGSGGSPELAELIKTMQGECLNELLNGIRQDSMQAVAELLPKLTGHVAKFLQCQFGMPGAEAQKQANDVFLGCLIKFVICYFTTGGDIMRCITEAIQCVLGGLKPPQPPSPPSGNPENREVTRCP